MTRKAIVGIAGIAMLWAAASPAVAADKVSGTFTVAGRATKFAEVYATVESDPRRPSTHYLILIVSDLPVPPAERTPRGLFMLASAGRIHALRIRWTDGTDTLTVTPYHQGIAESGRAFEHLATLDLRKYDDSNVDADFTSKALGQPWQFSASIKAAVAIGGTAVLEAEPQPAAPSSAAVDTAGGGGGDAAALKRQLGGMGYEFKPDALFQAIGDHNVDAVSLFLRAGMSPNVKNEQGRAALNHAVLLCGDDAVKGSAIVVALVKAKGDVKSKDPDNKTTPLVGSVQSCTIDAVDALIKAGSDLTARSAGGATALQLAEAYGRQDIAALLRKAGGK